MKTDYLENPKFACVIAHHRMACAASRLHSEFAREAFAAYGDHGPDISGCVRSHFPENVKDVLRSLARMVTIESDQAMRLRPARVRRQTVNHIGRLVATRYGAGFYGHQPYKGV